MTNLSKEYPLPVTTTRLAIFKRPLIKWSAYLLVLFFLQEIFFRWAFPLPELQNFDRVNYMNISSQTSKPGFMRHKTWYWESLPDTNYAFTHYMNGYGFRGRDWDVDKQADKTRIFFIGDSFVEGIMAPQAETIPLGFEATAGKHSYEVLNGGMMGVGMNSYLRLMADVVPTFKPDVVFVVLYANDMPKAAPAIPTDYIEPVYYPFWRPRLAEFFIQYRERNPIPFRWSVGGSSYLPAVPAPNNPLTERGELFKPHIRSDIFRAMKAGRFNSFKINQIIKEEERLKQPPSFGKSFQFLQLLKQTFQTQVIVVYVPARHQVTNYYYPFDKAFCQIKCPPQLDMTREAYQIQRSIIARECATHQLPFIDLTEVVKEAEAQGNHLYWDYDDHMRGKGYLLMGKTIFERSRPLLPAPK